MTSKIVPIIRAGTEPLLLWRWHLLPAYAGVIVYGTDANRNIDGEPSPVEVSLPGEWFLRQLLSVDLDDDAQVIDIARQFGPIHPPPEVGADPMQVKFLPWWIAIKSSQWWADQPTNSKYRSQLNSVVLARLHLKLLQVLVRHWRTAQAGGDIAAPWFELIDTSGWPAGTAIDEDTAWQWWVDTINAALQDYYPMIDLPASSHDLTHADQRHGCVYTSAIAQLVNHVAEGAISRPCVECGQIFVRQDTDEEREWQRKAGTAYCGKRCKKKANNRAQRTKPQRQ